MLFPQSSVIVSGDYDPATRVLILGFRRGYRYRYAGVPQHIYDGLVRAPSKGRYFDDFIRGKFPSNRC